MTVVSSAAGGHQICPVVATRDAAGLFLVQGGTPFPGQGLGQADAVVPGSGSAWIYQNALRRVPSLGQRR